MLQPTGETCHAEENVVAAIRSLSFLLSFFSVPLLLSSSLFCQSVAPPPSLLKANSNGEAAAVEASVFCFTCGLLLSSNDVAVFCSVHVLAAACCDVELPVILNHS